jgi:hypothetical protein
MKNDVGYIRRASRSASKIANHFLKQAGMATDENNDDDDNDVTG